MADRVTQLVVESITSGEAERITQLIVEALVTNSTPNRVTQLIVEAVIDNSVPEPEFEDGTIINPLGFLELTLGDGSERAFAEVDLNDDADYHMGYKAPWIKGFKSVSRGLSDRSGQMEHATFGALLSDTERYFRGLLESPFTKHLVNRPMAEWVVNDDDRRLKLPARLAMNGYVTGYSPRPGFQFDITGGDWLKKKFSRKARASQAWQPLITLSDFNTCPAENLNKGAPLVFGVISDEGETASTGDPPTIPLNGVPGGSFPYGIGLDGPEMGGPGAVSYDDAHRSFGVLPGTKPTSPSIIAVAGGNLPSTRNESWSAMITAVHSGVESDPTALVQANIDHVGGERSVQVSWTAASGGADNYRVYLTNNPFGVTTKMSTLFTPFQIASDFCWMFEVSGASSSLTITAPGSVYPFQGSFVYRIRATFAGGLLGPASGEIVGLSNPYRRPLHLRWLPVTGATGYRIERRPYSGTVTTDYDTVIEVGPTGQTGVQTIDGVSQLEFFDDFTTAPTGVDVATQPPQGALEPIYVGSNAGNFGLFLISRGAISDTIGVYVGGVKVPDSDFGVRIYAPHKAGYATAFGQDGYVVINGKRYAILYADPLYTSGHLEGTAKITVNVKGYDDLGTGLGTTVRSIVRQRQLFILNFLAADEPPGDANWSTASPVFPHMPDVPLVDLDSYNTVESALIARLGNGSSYEGGVVIGANGELVSALDALAMFNLGGDFDSCFDHRGSEYISAEPVFVEDLIGLESVDDVISITEDSFAVEDDSVGDFYNVLPYAHTRDYANRGGSGWRFEDEERDESSIAAYDQERASNRWDLHCCRADTAQGILTIADTMARKRARYRDPRRTITFTIPLSGMSYEPGQVLPLTHVEGIGAEGWVDHFVRVLRHELLITEGVTRLTCYDLGTGLNLGGYWADEDTPDWEDATEEDRERLLWWSEDGETTYSDGEPVRNWS